MSDLSDDRPKYYINPKVRQLFKLHLYRERIIGEVTVLNSFRIRRIHHKPPFDEEDEIPQIKAYDKKLRSAIDQADKLIEKLTATIDDLEQNV